MTRRKEETPEEEAETDSTSSEGGPDLVVQAPSVSAVMLTPGQEFTLHVTVHNQGDEQAAATMLHYYRSNNATITSSDTEVGTDEIGVLDASATSAGSIALTVPTSVSAEEGIYYGACVASVRGESNTDNNCSSAVKITLSGQETPGEEETEEEEAEEATEEEEEDDTPVTIPDANLRSAIEDALGKAKGATVTVAEMKRLTRLHAPEAGIGNLTGLEFATNLKDAVLWGNRITNVSPLSGLTNLRGLEISGNAIMDVSALSGLTNLTYLALGGNAITDVSALSGLTNLTYLALGGNAIMDVSALSGLTNLTSLGIGYNDITDVSALSGLTNLRGLEIRGNDITDVSALSGLTNLTSLQLGSNNIADISALSDLTNLTELDLGFNNRIRDLSALVGLPHLISLDIRGNPLSDSSINDHVPALKSNGVTVLYDFWRVVSDFDIELVLLSSFTERQKEDLQYAVRRWMAVITKDLPDYTFTHNRSGRCGGQSYEISAGERIDDLRIYVRHEEMEVGGWGGPTLLREETHLPVIGCMAFNPEEKRLLPFLAIHEIGHVLGFGSIWKVLGFYQNPPDGDEHFNGPLAIAAFNDAGGWNYTGKKVPLEDRAHWRLSVLPDEVMITGSGGTLSAITVQSLADLGYGVDVSQADPYTLPGAAGKASAKIAAAEPSILGVDIIQADVHALLGADPHGQGRIAGGLPLLPGDDRLRGRLESAEKIGGRGFDLSDNRLMGRLVPSTRVVPKLSCGVDLRREPIYVIDPQGRIIRTISH